MRFDSSSPHNVVNSNVPQVIMVYVQYYAVVALTATVVGILIGLIILAALYVANDPRGKKYGLRSILGVGLLTSLFNIFES